MTIEADDPGARIPRQRAVADEAHLKRSVEGAPVRDFVPLLVQKQAMEELLDYLGPRAEATVLPPWSIRR